MSGTTPQERVPPEQLHDLFANANVGLVFSLAFLTLPRVPGLKENHTWLAGLLGDFGAYLGFLVVAYLGIGILKLEMRAAGELPPKEAQRGRDVTAVVWSPANVLHEYTHGVVAVACGGTYERVRRDDGRMGVDVQFPDGARGSTWGLVATSLAPTIVGGVLMIGLGDWAIAAVLDPAVPRWESVARIIATAFLVRYSWPSQADLRLPVAVTRKVVSLP